MTIGTQWISVSRFDPIDQATGQEYHDLPRREVVLRHHGVGSGGVSDHDVRPGGELLVDVLDGQTVSHGKPLVVFSVAKDQRQHAEIDEILPVDASEALGKRQAQTEEPGAKAACSRLEPWP